MSKPGRKSTAELQIASLSDVGRETRPLAPNDLTDEEANEWEAVVNRCPATWFPRETHAVLSAYCRHVVGLRRLSQLVFQHEHSGEGVTDEWIARYDQLLRMREREARALSSLATRLRITNQATVDPRKKKDRQSDHRPWEG